MERVKSKVLKNSEQLKEEFQTVQSLLANILEKNEEVVKDITNLNDGQMVSNKKYFLNMVEFQFQAIQKLFKISLELDEFLKQSNLSLLENISNLTCKSELSLTCSSAYDTIIISKPSTPVEEASKSFSLLYNEVDESIKVLRDTFALNLEKDTNGTAIDSLSETNKHKNEKLTDMKPKMIAHTLPLKERKNASGSASDSLSESNKCESKRSSAYVSSSEEINKKGEIKKKTVQEKLKSKKLMTRRDRFLQNIQRPEIPDLSFKPTNKVFNGNDSYITCLESSSSTSVSKQVVERKRKKKRNIEKAVKIFESAIVYKEPPKPYVNLICLVSRIVSPFEFYINVFDTNVALVDTISHQLGEIYKDTNSSFQDKKLAMETLGNDCVCYLESYDAWYRVIVMNWRLKARDYQEDQVTIFLVDYGHICNTSYKNLREISEEFCCVPKCAIRCHLAWLYPPGSSKNNLLETWPKQSLECFFKLFPSENETLYKLVYVEKFENSWGVDIIKEDDEDESNTFGQIMLDGGDAVEIFQDPRSMFKNDFFLRQVKTAQGLAGVSQNMNIEERLEKFHENTGTQEYNNIDQAMLRYKANDEARICKNMRPDGTCFKGKKCKLEHKKLRPDGFTTDKQCVYVSPFKQLELPDIGATVKLQVTNVVSVNTFYACLVNSEFESLRNLITTMNKRDTIAKYKPLEVIPARGELVIVKSWNNSWYRAQVKDVYHFPQNSEETVQVFFVDIGEIFDTKISELRTITHEFLYVPFQAIFCRLYNVQLKEEQDPEQAKSYCESHFLCQIFKAEIMHVSASTLEVLLKKMNSEDVGEQIIEDGFGELRTNHEFPTEALLVD